MRGSILGSGLIHAAMLIVLFYVRTPASLVVPGPESIQVALIDPGAPTPVAPPVTETPPPAPKLEEIKPVEDIGVKLAPEPAKKKKPVKPPEEQPPPQETPALPSASVGSAGLRGEVSLDVHDFAFTYYLVLVRNKIAANWEPPAGLATGGRRVRTVVYFRISRGGEVTGVRLEGGSGIEFFDRSALRAVMISDPLPHLPLGFDGADLGVHFGFDWETP
jgi:TonB family protein